MSSVAWDYIVPVSLPDDLKGVTPGKLDDGLLRAVPGGGKLHWRACDAWCAMVAKAKEDGVELKPTSSGDLYRSYESQKSGFLTRYSLEDTGTGSTKTFEGKTWYLKKGMAMLATPGKSQHNLGLAIDIASASEPKRLNWLIANVKNFGFSWEVVPSEPWHIRLVTGDNPTAAVIAHVSGSESPSSAPAPKAEEPKAEAPKQSPVAGNAVAQRGKENSSKNPVLKLGDKGESVKILQSLLVKWGCPTSTDGDFGPKTEDALKAYQKKVGLQETGIVNAKTWLKIYA